MPYKETATTKLKLLWLAPQVEFKGRGIIDAWGDEMTRAGWETVSEPPCDLVFFGSDSQLREELIGQYPTICFFWGYDPARLLDSSFRQFAQGQVELMARCTRVLVPGPLTQYQLADWGLASQICIPGIDARTLTVPEPPPARRNRVMFLSRLAPHKGLEVLIEAVSMLTPQPELLICGPGNRGPYERLATDLGVKAEFRELDDSEKAIELARSMILAHPSRYEGFGMSVFEALACGTPVLVSSIPQHLWALKDHGLYFDDSKDLAEALASILSNPEPAMKMAAHGQEWVRREMSLEKACERLWVEIHRTIKEFLGQEIRREPSRAAEIYDAEHRRNYAYGQQDVAGYNGPARFDPRWRRHWRASHLVKAIKEAGAETVLDLGCGPVYPTILALEGFTVTAADISLECLRQVGEIAEKWHVADRITTMEANACHLFTDGPWDAVVEGEIWEHLEDPAKAIAEGLRVLRPGGVLIATTPYGGMHWDPMHMAPNGGGWDDASLDRLLEPWKELVVRREKIAEEGTDPSCYFIVIRKPT